MRNMTAVVVAAYDYLVQGYDSNGNIVAESSVLSADSASGVNYFIYHIDKNKEMTQSSLLQKTTKLTVGGTLTGNWYVDQHIHVVSVDGSGNTGQVTNYAFSKCFLITEEFGMYSVHKPVDQIYLTWLTYSLLLL